MLTYNDENSLACSIYIAYYTAKNYYTIIRELPTGRGFADYVFIPRKNTDKPALIVELKYNKDADSAIKWTTENSVVHLQIHEKRYEGALKDYVGNMLLVGINYDKETKKHSCVIEEGV
ncbi:MAG: PD-(D/E)XK nuclease domain-containing protein [Lachnospiraceae bacterium]|nr:PD-(D/E)XK nuclease domain-containing protein [Lachnospiraceae bacterium]